MDFGASDAAHKQSQDPLPASSYLQERLNERRSRNPRPSRARQSDFGPRTNTGLDDDIFLAEAEESKNDAARLYDSSPLAPFARYGNESRISIAGTTLSAGGRRRRGMGAKELDEQMDRLTKQNFDLKLELDHRREQQTKMQAQIESMRGMAERVEGLQEEHVELLRINSQLVEELEKRDRAMQEAVDIICDLEQKVDDLEDRKMEQTRPSTAQADSGYAGTETLEQSFSSSPLAVTGQPHDARKPTFSSFAARDGLDGAIQAQTPARPKREPAFLSQKKASTNALRSVFLDAGREIHPVQSFNSILSKQTSRMNEDGSRDAVLNSPRLSVLSESSFPSMYSPRKDMSPERHAWEPEDDALDEPDLVDSSYLRQDSISRVSRWIEDRENNDATPSKSNRISSPLSARLETPTPQSHHSDGLERFQSLDDALSTGAGRQHGNLLQTPALTKPFLLRGQKGSRSLKTPSTPATPNSHMFGEPLFPPTPDSASTHMLRSSRSSFLDERSLLDTTPAPVKDFPALEPRSRATPKQVRSTIELKSGHEYLRPYKIGEHSAFPKSVTEPASRRTQREKKEDRNELEDIYFRSHRAEYHGYPDGASIADGTPSRFLNRSDSTIDAKDTLFDMANVSPPLPSKPARAVAHRRKSSAEIPSQRKPSLSRADTSPTYSRPWSKTTGRPASRLDDIARTPTSPTGSQSKASSIRTAIVGASHDSAPRALSPEFARSQQAPSIDAISTTPSKPTTGTPKAASVASQKSSLTQRTQQFIRRLSSSYGDRDRTEQQTQPTPARRERELSPLPTLTSTPSSAYANDRPSQVRRPSTSGTVRSPNTASFPTAATRPGTAPRRASRDGAALRPTLPVRTTTEPAQVHGRAASLDVPDAGPAKPRNPFRRGGSLRKAEGERPSATAGAKKPWR